MTTAVAVSGEETAGSTQSLPPTNLNLGELSFPIFPLFLKSLVENERGNEIGFGWLGFCVFLFRYNEGFVGFLV